MEDANEAQRYAEMEEMYEQYMAQKDVVVAVTLRTEDDLFNMMCAMNQARLEEITAADCMSRKESGLGRKP